MENSKLTNVNGYFEIDNTYESNSWLKVKIRTFAFGKNRNGSDILNSSLSNFNKAHNTVGSVPIVARYNEDKDDLEGHNAIMRRNKNDEFEIYHDTDAIGFTSPFTSFHFEEVNEGTEDNPEFKTYVIIEDVYLWKRYDATKKIIEWFNDGITPTVSMEIDNVSGKFDNDGYFQINDFEFTGICALGTDVTPCFPKAEIQLYTVNEFKEDLKQLLFELNQNNTEKQGGNILEQEKQATEEFENTELDTTSTEAETEVTDEAVDTETQEFENTEEKVDDEVEIQTEEETKEDESEEIKQFKLQIEQLESDNQSLQSELNELKTFKRKVEEDSLVEKFSDKLTEDEINSVLETTKDFSIEQVEEKLLVLFGKKNFSLTKESEKPTSKVKVSYQKDDDNHNPYKEFFKKYNK